MIDGISDKDKIRAYLMGKALQGAYTDPKPSRESLLRSPRDLATHIAMTVDKLMREF